MTLNEYCQTPEATKNADAWDSRKRAAAKRTERDRKVALYPRLVDALRDSLMHHLSGEPVSDWTLDRYRELLSEADPDRADRLLNAVAANSR